MESTPHPIKDVLNKITYEIQNPDVKIYFLESTVEEVVS